MKYNMKNYLFLLLIFFMVELNAQTIITDRPDQTESSSTIPQGSLQIESGLLLEYAGGSEQSERQILAPTTLFRYGITKGIEIRVLNQFESIKNELNATPLSGVSDMELGVKAQLFQKENINTEVAFLSHLIIPTGSKGLSNNQLGTINKLSISHQVNDNIGLGYNLGYNYFGEGKGDFTYSLVLGVGVTEKAAIYIEPYGDLVEFKDLEANFDAGFTYLVEDNFQLDFSFGTGMNYTMNYISIGFSWNIKKEH